MRQKCDRSWRIESLTQPNLGSRSIYKWRSGGLPYSEQRQMGLDEIKGGSPYGASTIAGGQGERQPSEQELGMARSQGRHVASIAAKLVHRHG
jgi:multimeric flavodoxin WrbA